jgi:hypothetical protein
MLAKRVHYCILKSDRFIIHPISRVDVCSYVTAVHYGRAHGRHAVKIACNELVLPANTACDGLLDREHGQTVNSGHYMDGRLFVGLVAA